MMAKQLNGVSLSGQSGQFMWVSANRPNGKNPLRSIVNIGWQIFLATFTIIIVCLTKIKSVLLIHLCYDIKHLIIFPPRWYAKRFLHPDIVAPYDYIFIWDEDLGVEHFNAEEWVFIVIQYTV